MPPLISQTNFENSQSLTDLIENLSLNNDQTEEIEPRLLENSPYYDNDSYIALSKHKKSIFSILSLNIQSLNAKFNDLQLYLDNYKTFNCEPSLISIQETWLGEDSDLDPFRLDGYTLVSSGKSCSLHGGVAFYIRNDFDFDIILSKSGSDIWDGMVIEIKMCNSTDTVLNSPKIVVGNIYRPPRNNNENIISFTNELNEIFSRFSRRKHVILCGDYNLDLLKFQEHAQINNYLENVIASGYIPKITLPTRLTHQSGTLIDNFLLKLCSNFSLTTSGILTVNISDHQPYFIFLDYLQHIKASTKFVKLRVNSDRALSNFRNDFRSPAYRPRIDRIMSDNPNESYSRLNNLLTEIHEKHFPSRLVRFNKYKHKKLEWLTSGILKSVAYKDKLYAILKRTNLEDPLYSARQINFKTYNRILRQILRAAKRTYYTKFLDKYKNDAKKTWNLINDIIGKSKTKKDLPDAFLIDGTYVSEKKTIADEMNKFFINIGPSLSQRIDHPNQTFTSYLTTPEAISFSFSEVSDETVHKAIDSLKPKSSSGLDGISCKLLKFIKYDISGILCKIVNQCLKMGVFPDALKLAKVIPIHKKNEDYLFDNYRPISLLSSVSKVFERIINDQIANYFTNNNLFYACQYGFRQNHSTELAATELIYKIQKNMDKKETAINIFLDLSKAFDTLDHNILLEKLKTYGFSNLALKLMQSYLSDRKQSVEYKSTLSDLSTIKTGVPQGSILGPLLFIIYVNDLASASDLFEPIMYADDTTLSANLRMFINHENTLDNQINIELGKVNTWLKCNKLALNISKTKAMLFHTRQRRVEYPVIRLDNHFIEFVDEFNFLGLHIDKYLSWKVHTNIVGKKVSKAVGILCRLKNILPAHALRAIYNSLMLPYFNYCILIWGVKSKNLYKIQKKAIRILTNSKFNQHTSRLFKQQKILKINDLFTLNLYKFCFKYINNMLPSHLSFELNVETPQEVYRTRQRDMYRLPRIRHEFARESIGYLLPYSLNTMPSNIKQKLFTHSFPAFKNYVKLHFFDSYPVNCTIRNCFVCST